MGDKDHRQARRRTCTHAPPWTLLQQASRCRQAWCGSLARWSSGLCRLQVARWPFAAVLTSTQQASGAGLPKVAWGRAHGIGHRHELLAGLPRHACMRTLAPASPMQSHAAVPSVTSPPPPPSPPTAVRPGEPSGPGMGGNARGHPHEMPVPPVLGGTPRPCRHPLAPQLPSPARSASLPGRPGARREPKREAGALGAGAACAPAAAPTCARQCAAAHIISCGCRRPRRRLRPPQQRRPLGYPRRRRHWQRAAAFPPAGRRPPSQLRSGRGGLRGCGPTCRPADGGGAGPARQRQQQPHQVWHGTAEGVRPGRACSAPGGRPVRPPLPCLAQAGLAGPAPF